MKLLPAESTKLAETEKSFIIGAHKYSAPPLAAGLYPVATPIGNLGDMTLRGLEVLAAADIVACEDTRTSRVLLDRYGIHAKTIAYHDHNAEAAGRELLRALAEGKAIAQISDAGTPILSDPGFLLARSAMAAGFAVHPVPGASALLAALCGAGLPAHNFFFGGFLPPKSAARQTALAQWQNLPATLIFYESPRRAAACLKDMAAVFGGERPACLCRELTKKFETFQRGTLAELAALYAEDAPRGEVVLVIGGAENTAAELSEADIDALLLKLSESLPPARAAHEAARRTGGKKQALYARLLALKQKT